jgi:predicted nicotinamide N-methyase
MLRPPGGARVRDDGGVDDLVEETVALRGRDVSLLRPRDSDALLTERAFEREELLPYWAELWPSSLALARALAARALRGARTVELGCGLGLPSIVAALAGARVLATDWSGAAVRFAAENAERNGARIETAVVDWERPEALVARGPFDLVLASDVLYEKRNVPVLLDLLPQLVHDGAEVWLADPGRAPAEAFLVQVAHEGFAVRSTPDPERPSVRVHRLTARAP